MKRYTVTLLAMMLLCAFIPLQAKVLVINSNGHVGKYAEAEAAFLAEFTDPPERIDLTEGRWTPKSLRNHLYDTYPEIVYAIGTKAYVATSRFIGERKIVFTSIVNCKRLSLQKTHYGIDDELHRGMQVTLLGHVFPQVKKVALLYSKPYTRQWYKAFAYHAKAMGIEVVAREISAVSQLEPLLQTVTTDVDAFVLLNDPILLSDQKRIEALIRRCDRLKLPVVGFLDSLASLGVSLVMSTDTATTGRQAAGVVKLLEDDRVPDQQVQAPAGSKLIINLKKIETLQTPYNRDALHSAHRVLR